MLSAVSSWFKIAFIVPYSFASIKILREFPTTMTCFVSFFVSLFADLTRDQRGLWIRQGQFVFLWFRKQIFHEKSWNSGLLSFYFLPRWVDRNRAKRLITARSAFFSGVRGGEPFAQKDKTVSFAELGWPPQWPGQQQWRSVLCYMLWRRRPRAPGPDKAFFQNCRFAPWKSRFAPCKKVASLHWKKVASLHIMVK